MANPKHQPDFAFEQAAHAEGLLPCGVDEAGRGPWAGPVVAAAVILNPLAIPPGLNDSKKLTAQKREALFAPIMAQAQVGIGIVDVARIDAINILQATYEAMALAVANLSTRPRLALVDGNRPPPLPMKVQTIVEGDGKCLSIAAASIIAKVTRDRLMLDLDQHFPHYGFASHKGYGTAAHAKALATHGPSAAHHMSFAPLRQYKLL